MHSALHVPNILKRIAFLLRNTGLTEEGHKELAALARTCSAFRDIALDELWRFQGTILNILLLMPLDLWEIVPVGRYSKELKPTRRIVESDWTQVLQYRHRVKILRCVEQQITQLNMAGAYEALRSCTIPGGFLFPSLTDLYWDYAESPRCFSFIGLFLGPSLGSLYLTAVPSDGAELNSILPVFPRGLVSLSMAPWNAHPPLSTFVKKLTRVRSLEIGRVEKSDLVHVGRLATLERLDTKLPAGMSFAESSKCAMFPVLRHCCLGIEHGDILSFISFMQTWNQPPLETLELTFLDQVPKDHIEECYHALATHIDPESLDEFKLDISSQAPGPANRTHAFIYPGTYLRLLSNSFPNLRIVVLRVPIGFDLDDAVIFDLARAWGAQLEELSLITDDQRIAPRNTLRGLRAFAEYCPHLEKLAITFDARSNGSVPEAVEGLNPTRQFGLADLDVGFSRISPLATYVVARFLSGHFPCLERIKALGEKSKWKQVQDMLAIREVRRSARRAA